MPADAGRHGPSSAATPNRLLAIVTAGYALLTACFDRPRPELFALALISLALLRFGKRVQEFVARLLPYLLFALVYDSIRYGRDAFLRADRVNVCGIRELELSLFGFGTAFTPGDFAQRHLSPFLDLLFAAPYFVFAYVVLGYAIFLNFVDRPRMSRFLWAFFTANVIAFAVWLAFPVAPPWYERAMGCIVDLSARPSPAGLLRVDHLLQLPYFQTFYGKSTYVFGAMPSLHCTYPMIGLLTAWPHITWRTKPLHLAYVTLMFFASIYLDHHYVLDGLAGFCLAATSVWLVGWLPSLRRSSPPSVAEAT